MAREEKCEFQPFVQPFRVHRDASTGRVRAIEFQRTFVDANGQWQVDAEQTLRLRADTIISAFGSRIADQQLVEALEPLALDAKSGCAAIDRQTMQADGVPWLFAGGDIGGVAETTVEAVNDGKQAAWFMHR